MNWIQTMNELVKQDLSDIAQVNVPSWFTLGWVNDWSFQALMQFNISNIQGILSIILLLLTIGFTGFKVYRAYVHFQWSKKDRNSRLDDTEGGNREDRF